MCKNKLLKTNKKGIVMKTTFLKTYLIIVLISFTGLGQAMAQSAQEKVVFEKIVASAANMQTMSADFTEKKQLKMLSEEVVNTGKIWYKSPAYMRWEYDNKNYGVYSPRGGYMVRNGQREGALSRGFSNMGRIITGLISKFSGEVKDFALSYKVEGKELIINVQPTSAKMKGAVERIIMKFDTSSTLIRSFEIVNTAGCTLITFSSVSINADVDQQLFN